MAAERETLELDVLFVGAGPASLAGAYHLARLVERHNEAAAGGDGESLEVTIAVLEKGAEIGSHALSGAVIDPSPLADLFPADWRDAPFEGVVAKEAVWWLTARRAVPLPVPPPLANHGHYVVSLGKLLKWMAPRVEAVGVDLFTGFAATRALVEDGRVVGVRTGDRGVSHDGSKKANFESGIDIRTRVTVLGEGPRGTLAKQLDRQLDLSRDSNPQVYSLGLKEIWQLPPGRVEPGQVLHTMGWPLGVDTFGGGFLYGMADDQLIVGLVVGLDYADPRLDPHREFQRFKTHPRIRALLAGGTMTHYGAKVLPEGGWWSMPRNWGDGFLVIGDSGGFLNSQRLKGIHLAMRSGMVAAETIFAALAAGDTGAAALSRYEAGIARSAIRTELWKVRNFHQAFEHGTLAGVAQGALGTLTGGRGWGLRDRLTGRSGHQRLVRLDGDRGRRLRAPPPLAPDGELTFDKLADVYHSGAAHEEDQPAHLVVVDPDVCVERCTVEYGNPCQRFCPAHVYEMVDDPASPAGRRLQINFSNCVHCKTCDIMDPYQVIDWVPPEGGGGPAYGRM
jgi:electron-transferring-flavoprotein dehydrogenase